MPNNYKQGQHGCPIGCKYCVITEVKDRREMWNEKTIIGINKAATILNPPPDLTDKKAVNEFYDFPLDLLRGDIVGFNALSDPFWPKYEKMLDYFLDNVPNIAKLVVFVSKFPIPEKTFQKLAKVPNLRLNISITGLDSLENTKTATRLKNLRLAKKYGITALPVVHPYIAGMSDLSFTEDLKAMGYRYIDVKGLRYDKAMNSWMSEGAQKLYQATNGEILIEDGWRDKVKASGLELIRVRDWYKLGLPTEPKLTLANAKTAVSKIIEEYANIISSDSNVAVVEAAVNRRL